MVEVEQTLHIIGHFLRALIVWPFRVQWMGCIVSPHAAWSFSAVHKPVPVVMELVEVVVATVVVVVVVAVVMVVAVVVVVVVVDVAVVVDVQVPHITGHCSFALLVCPKMLQWVSKIVLPQ